MRNPFLKFLAIAIVGYCCKTAQTNKSEMTATDLPPKAEVVNTAQDTGIVMVKVCVNQLGNVVSTQIDTLKSTMFNPLLCQKALESASRSKLEPATSPEIRCGWIRYDFKLKKK